jgi:hypothetical protein
MFLLKSCVQQHHGQTTEVAGQGLSLRNTDSLTVRQAVPKECLMKVQGAIPIRCA